MTSAVLVHSLDEFASTAQVHQALVELFRSRHKVLLVLEPRKFLKRLERKTNKSEKLRTRGLTARSGLHVSATLEHICG